jgi:hypothetical protein
VQISCEREAGDWIKIKKILVVLKLVDKVPEEEGITKDNAGELLIF